MALDWFCFYLNGKVLLGSYFSSLSGLSLIWSFIRIYFASIAVLAFI